MKEASDDTTKAALILFVFPCECARQGTSSVPCACPGRDDRATRSAAIHGAALCSTGASLPALIGLQMLGTSLITFAVNSMSGEDNEVPSRQAVLVLFVHVTFFNWTGPAFALHVCGRLAWARGCVIARPAGLAG